MSDTASPDDREQRIREWQAIATVWRIRAQALEDELAHLEARRLLHKQDSDGDD